MHNVTSIIHTYFLCYRVLDKEYADFLKQNATLRASESLFDRYQSHDEVSLLFKFVPYKR